MNISAIVTAVVVVGGVGLFLGIFLGIASIVFKVEVDEKEEAVLGVLPGNNCGGCGYPGCSGLAAAIAKGEAPVNACPVGGEPVGKKVAAIMGVEAGESVRMTAFVKCAGDCDRTTKIYEYTGVEDCSMVRYVPDGGKGQTSEWDCLWVSSMKLRFLSGSFFLWRVRVYYFAYRLFWMKEHCRDRLPSGCFIFCCLC